MADMTSDQPANGAPGQDTNSANTPQASGTEKTGRVNLHDLPEFRQIQAANDRRIAQMQQQYNATVGQLQQQIDALTQRDMSDEERSAYQQDRAARYIQSLESKLAAAQAAQERFQDLTQISNAMQTKFGVPVPLDVMGEAGNAAEAALLATNYVADQLDKQRKAAERQERKEANQVDVGGGRASTPSYRDEEEYREAKNSRDIARIHMRRRADAARGR